MPEGTEKPIISPVNTKSIETLQSQPTDIVTLLKTDPDNAAFSLDAEQRKGQIAQVNEELEKMGVLDDENIIRNTRGYTLEKILDYKLDVKNPNSIIALGGLFSTLYRQILSGFNEKRINREQADFLTKLLNTTVKYKNLDPAEPNFDQYRLISYLTQKYPRTKQEASDIH